MSGFGYNVLGFGANASSAAAGGASDDQFNRVSFLSHFEGSNNGVNNAFDDGSASNHTITANGNVTQGSFGPFARPDGEWGVSFHGDSSNPTNDYLQLPSSSDFDFGTGDFTIEFFFFARDTAGSYEYLVTFGNTSSATTSLGIYVAGGTSINLWNNGAITSSTSYNLNQWYHLAVVRASGTVKVYLDGSEIKSASLSSDISSPGGGNIANWRLAGDSQYFNGVISNVRVVKGTGVYTGNFTAPTNKLTAITNTVLLTCQSNRLVDNSVSGHTITPQNSPSVTAFGPILTSSVYDPAVNGASGYFDYSASTYLSAADSADWDFGSDNYTVEFWMYVTRSGVFQGIFNHWGDFSGSNIAWSFELNSSNRLAFLFKTSGITALTFSSSTGDYLNQWVHVAAVRNSNVHAVYLNGVSKATTTDSGTMNNCTDVLRVGAYQADYGFDGWICDARVVKGTAVYTGNFTPPTAPLTAITNTKLLLNMADGQAIDSAAQTNLTLYGNANTSTDQAKFGTASLHLDGTGDYVNVLPSGRGNIYNYTVEQWLYPTRNYSGSGNFDRIWSSGTALNNSVMLHLDNNTAPKIVLRSNDSIIWTSSVSISLNAWTHVAVSCDANGTRLYIDGTERATSSTIVNLRNLAFNIGTSTTSAGFFQGYIDDFRTSDFARYTSNFTAPTEAFADKGQ